MRIRYSSVGEVETGSEGELVRVSRATRAPPAQQSDLAFGSTRATLPSVSSSVSPGYLCSEFVIEGACIDRGTAAHPRWISGGRRWRAPLVQELRDDNHAPKEAAREDEQRDHSDHPGLLEAVVARVRRRRRRRGRRRRRRRAGRVVDSGVLAHARRAGPVGRQRARGLVGDGEGGGPRGVVREARHAYRRRPGRRRRASAHARLEALLVGHLRADAPCAAHVWTCDVRPASARRSR